MKLSKLITILEECIEKHGDMDCFTNGEHGFENCIKLEASHIDATIADCALSETYLEDNDIDRHLVVLHIGGY